MTCIDDHRLQGGQGGREWGKEGRGMLLTGGRGEGKKVEVIEDPAAAVVAAGAGGRGRGDLWAERRGRTVVGRVLLDRLLGNCGVFDLRRE